MEVLNSNMTWDEAVTSMYENGLMQDVVFFVGPEATQFAANKTILSLRSPVFYQLFHGEFGNQANEIRLPEDDPDIFPILVKYLYCNKVDLADENVISIYFGGKFLIEFKK